MKTFSEGSKCYFNSFLHTETNFMVMQKKKVSNWLTFFSGEIVKNIIINFNDTRNNIRVYVLSSFFVEQ